MKSKKEIILIIVILIIAVILGIVVGTTIGNNKKEAEPSIPVNNNEEALEEKYSVTYNQNDLTFVVSEKNIGIGVSDDAIPGSDYRIKINRDEKLVNLLYVRHSSTNDIDDSETNIEKVLPENVYNNIISKVKEVDASKIDDMANNQERLKILDLAEYIYNVIK